MDTNAPKRRTDTYVESETWKRKRIRAETTYWWANAIFISASIIWGLASFSILAHIRWLPYPVTLVAVWFVSLIYGWFMANAFMNIPVIRKGYEEYASYGMGYQVDFVGSCLLYSFYFLIATVSVSLHR